VALAHVQMVNPPLLLHEVLECIKGGGRKKRIPASPNPWLQARARCVVMPNFVANSMNISRRSKKLYPSATDSSYSQKVYPHVVSTCTVWIHLLTVAAAVDLLTCCDLLVEQLLSVAAVCDC